MVATADAVAFAPLLGAGSNAKANAMPGRLKPWCVCNSCCDNQLVTDEALVEPLTKWGKLWKALNPIDIDVSPQAQTCSKL